MIQLFLKGIIIGIANIMPGVSGGTLAVIMGVYDKLTEAIGNFPTAPVKKKIDYIKFLLQIGSGAAIGIILFARVIEFCFTNYPRATAGGFSLLILPSIPYIIKGEDKKDKKIRTPITHTNRKNAYMHKTGVNGNVLFKSRLYLWL